MTDDLPLGLRAQLEGTQVGGPQGWKLCDWCNTLIEAGDYISIYAYRGVNQPWYISSYACEDCNDVLVGIPTKGYDEVMVRCRVVWQEGYKRKLWLDFTDSELLDREPPTVGDKGDVETAEDWIGASSPPINT